MLVAVVQLILQIADEVRRLCLDERRSLEGTEETVIYVSANCLFHGVSRRVVGACILCMCLYTFEFVMKYIYWLLLCNSEFI